MVSFRSDNVVEEVKPAEDIHQLGALLSLLCGHEINVKSLSSEAQLSISQFLARVRRADRAKPVLLSYEEFNELLLLFNQYRVEPPFFHFFFLGKTPGPQSATEKLTITFDQFQKGVTRFRGFAMLCFGNFRFAYRRLSEEKDPTRFKKQLDPWIDGPALEIQSRHEPLLPMAGTEDEIEGTKTWMLGYLSMDLLKSDTTALEAAIAEIIPGDAVENSLRDAQRQLVELRREHERVQFCGTRNTTKYLTWDFLDVYVATSMRQRWEFEETFDFCQTGIHY